MRALGASRTSLVPGGVLAGPWVRDDLWRRARAVPSLDLRFADNKSLIDAVTGASLVTFTRASSGTFVGSDGVLQTAATNVPRFDHNPTTGESLGLLVEEQRTNLLLNSGTLSTQSVTVTAVAHTLSFTGTGTITLTGTSTAGPLVGTGTGESNRVSLTFTPTAGSLTLTVSGTITNAQLEVGSFRTSYISTTGAAVTRNADVASITGSAFSGWYRQDEGTVFADFNGTNIASGQFPRIFEFNDGASNNAIRVQQYGPNTVRASIVTATVTQFAADNGSVAVGVRGKTAFGSALNDAALVTNGASPTTDATYLVPSGLTQLSIGSPLNASTNVLNSTIRRLTYWPSRLSNITLQQITQ